MGTPGAGTALQALPLVAFFGRPLVKTQAQTALVQVLGERVHRVLPAGRIEHQVIGVVVGVHAPARLGRLDNVHHHGGGSVPSGVDDAFKGAQAPRPQADDTYFRHRTSMDDTE